MMNQLYDFANALHSAGLGTPQIEPDGDLHRFHVDGDRAGSRNGWYILHLDGLAAGAFGSWKSGVTGTWRSKSDKPITQDERRRIKDAVDKAKRQRRMMQSKSQQEAATRAAGMWDSASPAMFHPYLKKKHVLPLGIRQKGNLLVIPMRDVGGKLRSCQTIDPNGRKLFLKGGRVRGCFYIIGGPIKDLVFVCEGFATGASLHQHDIKTRLESTMRQPIAVAFNAKNLKPVAETIARRHPKAKIIIAADNDHRTPGNPGITAAREAAAAVSAPFIYPGFDDEPFDGTDFNDYCNGGGR